MDISLENFIANQNIQVTIIDFVINLLITALLSGLLAYTYTKIAKGFSDKGITSNNFIYVAMTTMLIITIVKSSLALSLGLVGALSIVRFRTAIKDPEELSYLFLSIAIGLGLGANQRYITIVGFLIIVAVFLLNNFKSTKFQEYNLYLVLKTADSPNINMMDINNLLTRHCQIVDMKRYDETNSNSELVYFINCTNINILSNIKYDLNKIDAKMEISFSDINVNI